MHNFGRRRALYGELGASTLIETVVTLLVSSMVLLVLTTVVLSVSTIRARLQLQLTELTSYTQAVRELQELSRRVAIPYWVRPAEKDSALSLQWVDGTADKEFIIGHLEDEPTSISIQIANEHERRFRDVTFRIVWYAPQGQVEGLELQQSTLFTDAKTLIFPFVAHGW